MDTARREPASPVVRLRPDTPLLAAKATGHCGLDLVRMAPGRYFWRLPEGEGTRNRSFRELLALAPYPTLTGRGQFAACIWDASQDKTKTQGSGRLIFRREHPAVSAQ